MTKPLPANPASGPLEEYAARFDHLFATLACPSGSSSVVANISVPSFLAVDSYSPGDQEGGRRCDEPRLR